MEREKKDLSFILILLSTLIGIAVLFQWAIVNGLYVPLRNPSLWEKLMEKGMMFRFLYVILIGGFGFFFLVRFPQDASREWVYASRPPLHSSAFVSGLRRLSLLDTLLVFP